MYEGNILLINPPAVAHAYKKSLIGAETLDSPTISLPQIASPFPDNFKIKILDLDLYVPHWNKKLTETVNEFKPEYVGITSNTSSFHMALKCAEIVKSQSPETMNILGGVHCSIFPGEALKEWFVDYIIHGEGDIVFYNLLKDRDPAQTMGVGYKTDGTITINKRPPLIKDLDILKLPRYDLMEIHKYKGTSVLAYKGPAGYIESSRGCNRGCTYCNKSVFGNRFRPKSPERILEEVDYMLELGFKWIHFIDDGFGTNEKRIIDLCDLILSKGLKFKWTALSGVAGDQWTEDMFVMLKKAGCVRLSFGVESGNQSVLDKVNKGITLDQIRNGVRSAKKYGLETLGFFIIGLPGETTATAQDTIDFSKELKLDLAKFSIVTPNPGTPLFDEWSDKGYIISRDWSKYLFHNLDDPVFEHPNLSTAELQRIYHRAYRQFYLRWTFFIQRFMLSFRNRSILKDLKLLILTKW